ncbi:MAG TPA: pilus assembly protein TadG-related protein [Candidatus Acidoferrales bacterium]|nr:pilus assembly protein TadG-related protein [Candidatus Acidoferrales bacterium]
MNKPQEVSSVPSRSPESGQAMVFVLLALGTFLIAAVAFTVDLANLWFHRQTAQTAADAACMAGAMDMLLDANGGATGNQGFTPGTAFDCSAGGSPAAMPCQYALKNGYNSQNTSPGNLVSVSFPSSVGGASTPPSSITSNAFMRVDVLEHVQMFFSPLVTGAKTQDVRAFAVCGTILSSAPIPILVLHPTMTGSLQIAGSSHIRIVGGPQRSIQVNSSDANAVSFNGNPTIDLSLGGGSGVSAGTGSDFGTFGGPPPTPSQFVGGTTGHWISPAPPIADPYAQTQAPAVPTATGSSPPNHVLYGVNGCPDVNNGCDEYTPGSYTSQIDIKNKTAIFDPGVYYLSGSGNCGGGSSAALCLDSGGTIRPSTVAGDGSGGTMFYFAGTTSIAVGSNSGKSPTCTTNGVNSPNNCIDAFPVTAVKCTSTSSLPTLKDKSGNTVTTLDGNVMLGACTSPVTSSGLCAPNCSINYGDPLGTTDPNGEQRNLLFFQNRTQNAGTNPNFGGGGTLLVAGTMYFHQCKTSGTDIGTGCVSGAYNDQVSLGGSSGGSTYVLGDIITDQLQLGGTPGISMTLNPNPAFFILKATLLR